MISLGRKKPLLSIAIIIITCLGVYLNTLSNNFVYDDVKQVLNNSWIRDISHISDILLSQAWSFEGKSSNYYRPLAFLIYMIDYRLFGIDPWGYHLTSVLLHAGVSILVFLIASILMQELYARKSHQAITLSNGQVLLPLMAGLLFATHPIHSEPVMWISSLSDVSFTLFYLLAFYFYVKGSSGVNRALAPVFFFISCLGKETALTLPIMLFAYDASVRKDMHISVQGMCSLLARYLPFILVAFVYFALRMNAIGEFAPVQRHLELSGYQYFINVFPLFAQYLGALVLPINLNAFHVLHPISSLLTVKGLVGVATTLCYIGACYRLTQTNRVLAFCLIWISIPLITVLYIPALGENTFAERYLYLPSVGFVLLVSAIGSFLIDRFRALSAVIPLVIFSLTMLVSLYAFETVSRIPVWESNLALWSDVVRKSPNTSTARNNLASAMFHERRFEDAIEELKLAIRLDPANADAHDGLGAAYFNLGRIRESTYEHKEAVKLNPQNSRTHFHLGLAYKESGALSLAISEFQESIRLNSQNADAHYVLGITYSLNKLFDEAIVEFETTIRLQPDNSSAYVGLGSTLGKMGKLELAIQAFKSALSIDPSSADAHYNLGIAYNKTGQSKLAIIEFEKLLQLRPDHAIARQLLRSIQINSYEQSGKP